MFALFTLVISQLAQSNESIAEMIAQLKDPDSSIRSRAAEGLAKLGDKLPSNAITAIVGAMTDTSPDVRLQATLAIKNSHVSSVEVITALIRVLELDRFRATSWEASSTLIRIGKPCVGPLIQTLKAKKTGPFPSELIWILGQIGSDAKEAVPVVENLMATQAPSERLFTADALIRIDPASKTCAQELLARIKDPELRYRLMAARALARSTSPNSKLAIAVLLDILRAGEAPLNSRFQAAVALSYFGPSGAGAMEGLSIELKKNAEACPALAVLVAGTMIKIDKADKLARAYLENHQDVLREFAGPNSDTMFSDFANDVLVNVLVVRPGAKP